VAGDGPLAAAEFFAVNGDAECVAGGGESANEFVVSLHAGAALTFSRLSNVATPSQLRTPSLRVAGACASTATFTVEGSGAVLATCAIDVAIRDSYVDAKCAPRDVYVPDPATLTLALAADHDCDLLLDAVTFH
jgi:hypothetical protein